MYPCSIIFFLSLGNKILTMSVRGSLNDAAVMLAMKYLREFELWQSIVNGRLN
jgi:hypothetical protein